MCRHSLDLVEQLTHNHTHCKSQELNASFGDMKMNSVRNINNRSNNMNNFGNSSCFTDSNSNKNGNNLIVTNNNDLNINAIGAVKHEKTIAPNEKS